MKYRNKNYIGAGTLPLIMLPVVAITIGLTLWISDAFNDKPANFHPMPSMNLVADREALLADTPEFQTGDMALFNFTGDTVLVVTQPDSLAELSEEVRVLHKTVNGTLETVDLPGNWLVKIPADTVPVKNPVIEPDDKFHLYKKATNK
jgi:hypothetical protein